MYQLLILLSSIYQSVQHGYLAWPPNRSSLWRYGYDTPKNYNDNALYCGGRRALEDAKGKCGVCGDPFNAVREHEANGIYASGIITERYPLNTKTITVTVLLTVNHKGYFDFRLCPHNNVHVPVRQECLDKFVLPIQEGSSKYHRLRFYPIKVDGPIYNFTLEIPRGMICSQCVLQWRYRTENSWGMEPNGTGCIGCGLQEEFYNCADISIGMDSSLKQDKNRHDVTQKTRHKIHYIKKPLQTLHGTTIKNNEHLLRNTQVTHPNSNLEMSPSNQLTETRIKTMRGQHVIPPVAVKAPALNPSSSTDFKTIGIPKTVIRNVPSTSKLTTRGSIRVAKKFNKTGKTFIFWRKGGKTNRIISKYPRRKPQLRSTSPLIVSKQFTSTKPTPSFSIKKQLTTKRSKSSSMASTTSTSTRTMSSPVVSKIPTSKTTKSSAIVSTSLTSNQQPSTSIFTKTSTSTRPLISSIVSKPVTSTRVNSSSIVSRPLTSTRANTSPIVSKPSTSTTTKSPPVVSKPSISTRSNSSPIVSKPLGSTRTIISSIVSKLSTSTTKNALPIVSKPTTSTRSRSSPIVLKPSTSTRTKSSPIVSKSSTLTRTKSSSVISKPPTLTTPKPSSVVSNPSTSTRTKSSPIVLKPPTLTTPKSSFIVSKQPTNQTKSKSTRAQKSSSIVSKLIFSKQPTSFVILSEPSMPLRPKLSSSISQPSTSTRPNSSSILSKQLTSTRPKLSPALSTPLMSIITTSSSIVSQSLTSSPVVSTQLTSTKPNSSSVVSKTVSLTQPVPPFILSKTSMSTGPKMTAIVSNHLTSTRPTSLPTVPTPLVSTRSMSSSIVSEQLKSTTPHLSFIASKTMSPRQPSSSFSVTKALTARRRHASFSMLNPSTPIVHLGNIKPTIPVSFRNFSSSNVNVKEIDINLLSNSIRSLGVVPTGYNSSRTFVLTPEQKTKTSFPIQKKYIIVRKASKGLNTLPNGIQNNPNPSNYIVRRRQIRIPKAMVQGLKAQDLLKHIQQQFPELRDLRDFSGIKQ